MIGTTTASEGERKLVTVMFCDLVNSTGIAELVGPDEMHTLLNRFFDLSVITVQQHQGTVNQFLGDGFMALFGAPVAYEDHARRAVQAAIDLLRHVTETDHVLGLPRGEKLAVRIGLNTGLVVVGQLGDNVRTDYTAVGDTTNLAARLQQTAQSDTVVISESTHGQVMGYFTCEPLGPLRVKGKVEPVQVYKVRGPKSSTELARERVARGLRSSLVGRESEMEAFAQRLARLSSGTGGIVSLFGAAGIGKSRLVTELHSRLTGQELRWLEGRALSFSRSISYWPFQEIIRRYIGISEEDGEDESWDKLQGRLRILFYGQVADVLPYLATLIGVPVKEKYRERVAYLDGQAMGQQIFRAARRFFEQLAKERPLVLVLEDWHWADQSSEFLLEHLLPLTKDHPLLVCMVARDKEPGSAESFREIARKEYPDSYQEIVLSPLSSADSAQLADNLLGKSVAPRVRKLVLEKTEGNPFFMEEVVRSLIAMGAIVQDTTRGAWQARMQPDAIHIPDTVQDVIMARVDRLETEDKEVLKLASVIGRSFFYRILQAIAGPGRELLHPLNRLVQVEILREKRRLPEWELFFKHALIQEAIYESIVLQRRKQLHAGVGACIEKEFADRLDEFYGLLAFHYACAENWSKAQEYLLRAGDQAGKMAADTEALNHYQQAIAAYTRVYGDKWDATERATLERKIGEAFYRRGEHRQATEDLYKALSLMGRPYPQSEFAVGLGIIRQLFRQTIHRLAPGLMVRSDTNHHQPVGQELVRIYEMLGWIDYFISPKRLSLDVLNILNVSEEMSLPVEVIIGSMSVGLVFDTIGLPTIARYYHSRAARQAEELKHPIAIGYGYLGLAMHRIYSQGNAEQALLAFHRSASAFRDAGDIRRWGSPTRQIATLLSLQGKFAQSVKHSRELIRMGEEGDDQQLVAWGLHALARNFMRSGDLDKASAHFARSIAMFESIPSYTMLANAKGDLGYVYLQQGKLDQALEELADADRLIAAHGLRGFNCSPVRTGLALAYLTMAEKHADPERARVLDKADKACALALRHSKIDRKCASAAHRLRGTLEWLSARRSSACKFWEESLRLAESLGGRYDLGLTHFEMGQRLNNLENLRRAEAIFEEIGAHLFLSRTRRMLQRTGAPPCTSSDQHTAQG